MSATPQALRISAEGGLVAEVLPLGATLATLTVPTSRGPRQVLATYPDHESFVSDRDYVGCVIGRTVNRVCNARFERDGRRFELTANEGPHSLHGGRRGFGGRVWKIGRHDPDSLTVSLRSPHGDQGYPGLLQAVVTFTCLPACRLSIEYRAWCDEACPVDMTHHLYFNLGGDIRDHELRIDADTFLELDHAYIPTGRLLPVTETPFDLRAGRPIRKVLYTAHPQLARIGMNQAFVLGGAPSRLVSADKRLQLAIETSQPCIQAYSGLGRHIHRDGAIALEPQGYVDAVNIRGFPTPWLLPGKIYRQTSIYSFAEAMEG